eukprot:TRINITY_DN1540_c0_g1_i2.p1 TRINITY_DN1540_c0_g1~~TRINITY_DN1540_c0_g1_i2.p1  ORF type:complete len:396 (+),score=137.99 TRINITY_DN1540_c0_g1_i2:161-1189(+)
MKVGLLKKFVQKHSANESDYAGCFEVAQQEVPKPSAGQVLVQIHRSPINPSDLSTLTGTYNSAQREELPCKMGFEASGVVVQSGGGPIAGSLVGKRVGVVSTGGGLFWAEYAVVNAMRCVELPDDVSYEEGCGCFVNPLTAIAFLEIAHTLKRKTIVHTAGASALGRMVIRLGKLEGVDVIPVVRKEAQVDELMQLGARAVIVTSQDGWKGRLKAVCLESACKLAFDAVGGGLTGDVLEAMPNGAEVRVYGGLSNEACQRIRPTDLIFLDKRVQGFWLTHYLKSKSMFGQWRWMKKLQRLLKNYLSTHVRTSMPLESIECALATYNGDMSAGKVCIAPVMTN